jgi:outer membrane protein assembly factor BamD
MVLNKKKYTVSLLLVFYGVSYGFPLWARKNKKADIAVLNIEKKEKIVQLFNNKRYKKVLTLMEDVVPLLPMRDRVELDFYQAYCNYYLKNYEISADQFDLFVKYYPYAPSVEEAYFMRGYSLIGLNIDKRLDQAVTYKALDYLEQYLGVYPKGHYVQKAQEGMKILQERLMKKEFQKVYFYLRLKKYEVVRVVLKNFVQAYPNSPYQELIEDLTKRYVK